VLTFALARLSYYNWEGQGSQGVANTSVSMHFLVSTIKSQL